MSDENKPVVLSYCSTFLKPETLHIYRQIAGLQAYRPHVLTRHRENEGQYPFDAVTILKKHPFRFINRFYWRTVRKQRVPLSGYEIRQILQAADRVGASLVHIYFGTEAAKLIPYLKQEKRPKIVSFHGMDTSDALAQSDLEELLECTDLFLARSQSLKDALIERGCPAERIKLNPTGVPIPEQAAVKPLPKAGSGEPVRLLQACRFIDKKGLDVTVDAVAELKKRGVPVLLDLAGSGPCEEALREQVRRLGLENEVRFLGFVQNEKLLQLLPDYHLFLHPSRTTQANDREGIPNSMLEAMAVGVPSISTRHSGIPEILESGSNGFMLERLDAAELAGIIQAAVSNEAAYASVCRNARETVIERHSPEKNRESLERVYSDVSRA